MATSDLIYFLDDDNIVHPNLNKYINDPTKAIVGHQQNKKGIVRLHAHERKMHVGGIDTAQVILPYHLAVSERWIEDNYCADGFYFEALYRKEPTIFNFINEVICYYNYLR